MNLSILNNEVQNFINTNLKADLTKLILKGSPFKNVTIQEIANQIVSKNKAKKKLPTWFSTKNIYFPNKLNIEQSSSEITAKHKTKLVSGKTLIDLTGGFGVDTFYFSNVIKKVIYCEINSELSTIAKHNFTQLGANNIICLNTNGIEYLKNRNEKFDWIYIDPSRR
ncbi:MAG TPA: hypothetical protein VJ970_04170, partial [Flavobacteriaceae bacterium]|nr:hypothetical protein [Flavobacteriaceae bacterium]